MTEIYLHIVARMADYMATHPYTAINGKGATGKALAITEMRRAQQTVRYISAGDEPARM